ncbi:unnamed protein product [Caenorhabditis angaria]|uniref:C6 domain-containing protein n=1 Tax=Caenorhabditis angaria TaxID=860376 RepID=A0A9P1IMC4_9PELO|nr:unnamed protein product [Caenorhabditis angaria]
MMLFPAFLFCFIASKLAICFACIPTQYVEVEVLVTPTTTLAPVCSVCTSIYEKTDCPIDPPTGFYDYSTDYCYSATQVGGVELTRGKLPDGYGDENTCYIDVACPSPTTAAYTRPDGVTTTYSGNLVATCSELTGVWQFREASNDPITNAVCRGST